MRWLIFFVFVSFTFTVQAQASCGPDAAPAQAAAQGYTCEVFRWGSGDTISEIDTGKTWAPGFKWYYNTVALDSHDTVAGDFSVTAGTGAIVTQTSIPADNGRFVLVTCGGPSTSYTAGQFFVHGFYAEFVGTWDSTGHTVQTGFYGLGYAGSGFPLSAAFSNLQWEVDDPDAYALDQAVVFWGGGSSQVANNTGGFVRHGDSTIQTGNKFGVLSTAAAVTWWYNDAANGSVDFSGTFGGPSPNAGQLFNTPICFGNEATAAFPMTLVSFKVWQAGPPIVGGGGHGTLLKRR